MGERYIKVFSGSENLYTDNAPVVIRASALLKDTETGKMIAQLKIQNISGKTISYVKAIITQLDTAKNPLGDAISFEYLDLAVSDKEEFGSKKPLPLTNSSTRSFCLGISNVVFADGSAWSNDNMDWKSAADNSTVAKSIAVEDTYKMALALSKSENIEDIKKAKNFFESIQTEKNVSIEFDLCERKIAKFEEHKVLKKRAKKIGFIGAGLCAVLALVGYFVFYPMISYLNGNYAVYINMYGIEKFEIPNGVTDIEDGAFYYCSSLTSVTIPDSVTSIGNSAFSSCESLTSVTIPDSVTSIGNFAFSYCESLTSVTIGNGVIRIGTGAFDSCSNLTSVTLGNSVTILEDGVFCRCGIRSIVIPENVTIIGNSAFSYSNIEKITYNGTKAQWNAIQKFFNGFYPWDSNTGNYVIYCTDGTINK